MPYYIKILQTECLKKLIKCNRQIDTVSKKRKEMKEKKKLSASWKISDKHTRSLFALLILPNVLYILIQNTFIRRNGLSLAAEVHAQNIHIHVHACVHKRCHRCCRDRRRRRRDRCLHLIGSFLCLHIFSSFTLFIAKAI